ncbi:MAG: CotH kinase family protein [Prevotellaceae bacterium]|jgi:hypothetical protein|nr:CotH kinase family protein [Prevotellaceae bacterium]
MMKNTFLLSFLLIFIVLTAAAQTSAKLNGSVISSKNNTDGYTYNQGTDFEGNTAQNCFDGNLNTFFASAIDESKVGGDNMKGGRGSKGGWVGLDLGSKHVITSVKYAPRPAMPERVECGVIEGANSADFIDAVAIGIISESGVANQLSTLQINSTRGFRYVRYYGSLQHRCNIAELEFYGYQSDGNDNHIGQLTNLPTVNIHTINEAAIDSKDVYRRGYITVVDGDYIKADSLDVRGRGNASWDFKKRPYRIKFDKSTYLFDNPAKGKSWTLLSNEGDKTLIRNLIAFDISKRIEMPYTPAGKLVDVVVNGDYKGAFQLCDQIDVRPGRVDIPEMTADDVDETAITGGYLIEIDAYLENEQNWENVGFKSARQVPVSIKSPDDDVRVTAQTNYIKNHFNAWEASIMAQNFSDPNNGFRRYTDIESFVRHFITGEFTGNTDTYWSVYMFKKRDDEKFYFGPVWDFDLAFENDQRTFPLNANAQQSNQWLYHGAQTNNLPMCNYCNGYWQGNDAYNTDPLIDRLLSDANLYQRLKEVWAHYRDDGTISEGALFQTIENYAEQISASKDLNFKRWDNLYSWEHMMEGRGDYAGNINIVKNYITERMAWFDQKLEYVPSLQDAVNAEFQKVKIFSHNNTLNISNLTELTNVICFDIAGRKVFEASADSKVSKTLAQGVYIVQLITKNGRSESFKALVR